VAQFASSSDFFARSLDTKLSHASSKILAGQGNAVGMFGFTAPAFSCCIQAEESAPPRNPRAGPVRRHAFGPLGSAAIRSAEQVLKSPAGLDLAAWLDRIEKGMTAAVPEVRWTMNRCLTEIGIHFPKKSASRHSQSVRSWESIAIIPVPMGVPFRSPRSGFTKW